MISGIVNLTTGPVGISREVMKALQEPPISHRSQEFKKLYKQTTEFLSSSFHVQETFLLTGSGTLANEAMLQEIKYIRGHGLIISNGEFGNRLIEQARRNNLNFITYQVEWGKIFDLQKIQNTISNNPTKWILFCHCETSTGVINGLNEITAIAKRKNCLCFVDCMGTVGTMPLDLSNVAMATASSGKGLASIPGLAVIFSNIELAVKKDVPVYLDLHHYCLNSGIPFTIPSNLINALYVSICQKLREQHFELLDKYGREFFKILNKYDLIPFSNKNSKVFTLVTSQKRKEAFIHSLTDKQILLSHESDYLKKRQWCQLASFGFYTEIQLKYVLNSLQHSRL
ncbi:MAG TPA: aminotransferase class V-fold PLP-dependent enzyme [Chitinophagaceae bacterium]|nr:aminotransferase class V-fold PLP-dependent enzyme [Chitinophagaceae bacterium]